jgi:hypothetical protein
MRAMTSQPIRAAIVAISMISASANRFSQFSWKKMEETTIAVSSIIFASSFRRLL